MLSSSRASAPASVASRTWSRSPHSTWTVRPGQRSRAWTTAAVIPNSSRWLSLSSTQSDRLPRWLDPPPARTAAFSSARRPGVVLRVSHTRRSPPASVMASTKRAVRVATPDRWPRKFSAVRSAVRMGASGPRTSAMATPAVTRSPSSAHQASSSWGSTWRKASMAQSRPARMPSARGTNCAVASRAGGSSADVRSPKGFRSSARARATASRTATIGGWASCMEPASAEAAGVLLERRVDREGGGHHQAAQRLVEGTVDLHHVVVGRGEHGLGEALPRLGDAGDLGAGVVLDVELPGPPVLAVDHAPGATAGLQREADLADHVLLDDRADRGALAVLHDDPGLHDLGRAGERQHHVAHHVHDLELVGEELVIGAEDAHRLLGHALADLAHRADLAAVLVVDGVLVVDLDELDLLVDHQDRLGEQGAAALVGGGDTGGGHVAHHLLRGAVDGRHVGGADRRID